MSAIHTISQLMHASQCQYQLFDLGRRIQPIAQDTFCEIEAQRMPYPYPLQRHAHLAIAYWQTSANGQLDENKSTISPWIWFLKFPLDERGLLNQTDIGNFLRYISEALGAQLTQSLTEEQQQHLANNPYIFKPSEDKMAMFHSLLSAQLGLAESQYYQDAQAYFTGENGWHNWQSIGLQGITDMCSRLKLSPNAMPIYKALPHLAATPSAHPALYALLGALEHVSLSNKLAGQLHQLAEQEINASTPDLFLLSALVRSLSGAPSHCSFVIDVVLQHPKLCHQEILIAIAGRCFQQLSEPKRAELFLLRLAQTQQQVLFNQLFADLVMIPSLRPTFLSLVNEKPSPELLDALLTMQKQVHSTPLN